MFSVITEQAAIYNSKSNRILVNAAPGTGKTVVVVCRAVKFANLLLDNNISWADRNAKVLVVSLTNYTADNVQRKVARLLKERTFLKHFNLKYSPEAIMSRIVFSTLHSFSLSMLVRFNRIEASTRLSIVDNEYNLILLEKILTDVKPTWKDDESIKKDLLRIKLKGKSDKKLKQFLRKKFPKYLPNTKLITKIIKELDQQKSEANLITFDDMILQFNQLLQDNRIRKKVHRLFPVILADEFQDISKVQWKLLRKLVGKESYLLCVGDDGQTIYTWNGASFMRFNHFKNRYPEGKIFYLAENLRSTKKLSAVSSGLIAQSRYATKKNLTAKRKGKKPKLIFNSNPKDNCVYIIEEIKRLKDQGISYNDIAVEYRYHRDGFELRQLLPQSKIPFKVPRDKSKRDRPIIRLVFSLIRIIESDTVDDDDWHEVLMKINGVGKKKATEIISWLRDRKPKEVLFPKYYKFVPYLKQLLSAIDRFRGPDLLNTEKLEMIFNFALTLPKVNRSIEHHIKPTLYKLASEGKLSDMIPKYLDRSYPLYYPVEEKPPFSDDYVTLSTIHGIKGGEFHTVFYLGTNDELYIKNKSFKKKKDRENELQVMNVAVTRARRRLYLLFQIDLKTWKKGKIVPNPWRFLRKVDGKLLNVISKK